MKRTTKEKPRNYPAMNRLVKALRQDGWWFRGEWPATNACRDRWDFVRVRTADSDSLFPLNPEACAAAALKMDNVKT